MLNIFRLRLVRVDGKLTLMQFGKSALGKWKKV